MESDIFWPRRASESPPGINRTQLHWCLGGGVEESFTLSPAEAVCKHTGLGEGGGAAEKAVLWSGLEWRQNPWV